MVDPLRFPSQRVSLPPAPSKNAGGVFHLSTFCIVVNPGKAGHGPQFLPPLPPRARSSSEGLTNMFSSPELLLLPPPTTPQQTTSPLSRSGCPRVAIQRQPFANSHAVQKLPNISHDKAGQPSNFAKWARSGLVQTAKLDFHKPRWAR